MKKITPFLMFKDNLEEAMNLYSSIFKNSKIQIMRRSENGEPGLEGSVMSAIFELEGQEFMAFNGGSTFNFSEAISLFVNCETQEEVDDLWEKLSEGGEKRQCGWVKDRFGVSWQIIPSVLGEMLSDADLVKSQRAMMAMLQMTKIDIQILKQAYEGK